MNDTMPETMGSRMAACGVALAFFLTSCAPTVQVAAPQEPIEINVNVKIEHEIRVKVDKELDDAIAVDDEIF